MGKVLKKHIDDLTMDDIYQYHHDGIDSSIQGCIDRDHGGE